MDENHEVKCWTRELSVSKEELQKAVDKVGNSASAVRKELSDSSRGARAARFLYLCHVAPLQSPD
jgi:hypothetical protein